MIFVVFYENVKYLVDIDSGYYVLDYVCSEEVHSMSDCRSYSLAYRQSFECDDHILFDYGTSI